MHISKKQNYIIKRKRCPKDNSKHTRSTQEVPQGKSQEEEGLQKLTHPHLEPNQSNKLINDNGPTSMNNLAQDQ